MHPFSSFFFLVLRVFVVTRQQKRIEVWLSTFSKSTNKIFSAVISGEMWIVRYKAL